MKVKIDTKTDTILAAEIMVKAASCADLFTSMMTKEQRTHLSILFDLCDRIESRAKTIRRMSSVMKKKVSLSLKYHEAVLLETYARENEVFPMSDYQHTLLNTLANQLNQKLA
jgi:hypothetical protein